MERGRGGAGCFLCGTPRLLFVCTCPCMGLMLFSAPRLTGPSLFMPFALIIWAGLSAGELAGVLRAAKWHSGVHWWKGLHACTQGGKAKGFSEGHYKERRCKTITGGDAPPYCMSEGDCVHHLWRHTVILFAYNAWVRKLWRPRIYMDRVSDLL